MIFSLLSFLVVQGVPATWTFTYPDDTKPGSLLDLRYLNERVAGETGYVHVGQGGKSFVEGWQGDPILAGRFLMASSHARPDGEQRSIPGEDGSQHGAATRQHLSKGQGKKH